MAKTTTPVMTALEWRLPQPGVNEILVHTYDITEGLGVSWRPPARLCAGVLARLFPDAPVGDPVQVLLWSTGRVELDAHARITSWIAKAALE